MPPRPALLGVIDHAGVARHPHQLYSGYRACPYPQNPSTRIRFRRPDDIHHHRRMFSSQPQLESAIRHISPHGSLKAKEIKSSLTKFQIPSVNVLDTRWLCPQAFYGGSGLGHRYAREASLAVLHDSLYFAEGSTFCPSSSLQGQSHWRPSLAEGA